MDKTTHVFRSLRARKSLRVSVGKEKFVDVNFVNGHYQTTDDKIAEAIKEVASNPIAEIIYLNDAKNLSEAEMILAYRRNHPVVDGLRTTENT